MKCFLSCVVGVVVVVVVVVVGVVGVLGFGVGVCVYVFVFLIFSMFGVFFGHILIHAQVCLCI